MRYIALLRGVNVGGNTMVKMEELRHTFEALRFDDVATYINSGNVAFDCVMTTAECGTDEDDLTAIIENAIEKSFGKRVPVIIRERGHISRVIRRNPFDGEFADHKHMHVLFMRREMPAEKAEALLAAETSDRFAIRGREIYALLKSGVADSLLGKGFLEKKLKVEYTARNWRTIERLATL